MSLTYDDVIRSSKAHGRPVGFSPSCAERIEATPRAAVRAWSALTAFGSLDETWNALLAGEFVSDHARVPVQCEGDRAVGLASRIAEHLRDDLEPDAALIVATSKGPVESWLGAIGGGGVVGGLDPTGLAQIAATVSKGLRISGPRLTLSAACASGLHGLIRGTMMIRAGQTRQVLVVAAESSLHPLFIGSFQRLGVLPKPGHGCRPFDHARAGFLMSEAAAAVLLQAAPPDSGRPADPPGDSKDLSLFVDRFALGGDATHLTGSDPEGKLLRHLLRRVIDGNPVDLVHAHGTGTETNDPVELAALEATVPIHAERPTLYSHKGALGHSLGAAGLLAVALNCQAHATGVIPPNPRTTDPLPARRIAISQTTVRRPVRRSLAVAAGFGGPTAVVSLVSGG